MANGKLNTMNNPISQWRKTKELHKYFGQEGKIVVWTKIFVPPAGYEQEVPYYAAIISFSDGKKKALQLADCDTDPAVGQTVRIVIRRMGKADPGGVIRYGLKAKPE